MFSTYYYQNMKKTFKLFADVNRIATFGPKTHKLQKDILRQCEKLEVLGIYPVVVKMQFAVFYHF